MLKLKIISLLTIVVTIGFLSSSLLAIAPTKSEGATVNANSGDHTESMELQQLLAKSAAYCEKLEDAALHYFCIEEITEVFNKFPRYRTVSHLQPGKGNKGKLNRYLYDYQIYKKYDRVQEKRILKEKNGKWMRWNNAPLLTRFATNDHAFYAPAALLSKERQQFFEYRVMNRNTNSNEHTILIEAKPKPGAPGDYNYGKAWIDSTTGAVMRVEIDNKSIKDYKNMISFAKKHGAMASLKIIYEYDLPHQGLRYPAKTQYVESYSGGKSLGKKFKDARYIRSNTSFIYKNYLFFEGELSLNLKDNNPK
jgi:hypothetical protein